MNRGRTNPQATGRVTASAEGTSTVVYERRFRAGIDDVWAAVTESDRLARWFGTWTGDPESGQVMLTMTAEEGSVPAPWRILTCVPPSELVVAAQGPGDEEWVIRISLSEQGGTTTLRFAQDIADDILASVGPGWDFYLDRLVAAVGDEDPDAVRFDDYFPALSEHYAAPHPG